DGHVRRRADLGHRDAADHHDSTHTPDRTWHITLSNAAPAGAAQLGQVQSAVLTIQDNDPLPNLSIGDATVSEVHGGSSVAELTVTLDAAMGFDFQVDYTTKDGTGTAAAIAGKNYTAKSGTLVFPAGTTSQTIRVTVDGGAKTDPDRTFQIVLSNASTTA